jgi:PAS domain S-box-containing protein
MPTKIDHKIDRQLGVLFDSTPEFKICMLDTQGCIIGWNLSAERMTGYTSKEVLGKSYASFISKEEARRNVLGKALAIAAKSGQFATDGIRARKDGSHFWARSCITPMKERDGSIKFFVVITRDVSREKAGEQKREEYIGIASHELRNPIATLSLYSELLAKRLELDRDKRNLHMLRDIQSQAARLVTLEDDLLIVDMVGRGALELHKEVFNPHSSIATIVRDFNTATPTHKIVLKGTFSDPVRADKGRIAQVLINLLTNAVKYSPGGKQVVVRIGRIGNKCVVSVRDFGSGIAKKDQRDIFTRFFRSNTLETDAVVGSGLGLYISKAIIKKHQGRLWVESVKGKGATFYFTLSLS